MTSNDRDDRWWRDAVVYEIYVRSFADSDGDGIGDLRGITARLDHIAYLGADAIWLTPFYRSPMVDGGYDVADYRDVDPRFGTLTDFGELLDQAHRRDLRVIIDVVPNHTSDQHPWFQAALASPPGSAERDRYIFRQGAGARGDEPPADWHAHFGGSAWSRTNDGQWYLHMFAPAQPDLNWANPEVHEEFRAILRFWLDRGVDGFRIDVANGLAKDLTDPLPKLGIRAVDRGLRYEGDVEHPLWDRDDVHAIYRDWRTILDDYQPPRMAVAEAWVPTGRRGRYVRADELHQAFNFDFLETPWHAKAFADVIDASLREAIEVGAMPTWVLSNHDVVRHATRYALRPHTETAAWLASDGIDPAVNESLGRRRARAALLLMLALPGSAYLYQGEELGLFEVADLPTAALQDPTWERSGGREKGRDGCRVPLPWHDTGPSLGFGPDAAWLPQPAQWAQLCVTRQRADAASMLNLYREALRLRRRYARGAARGGEGRETAEPMLRWRERSDTYLCFEYDTGLICAVNFGQHPEPLPPARVVLASDTAAVTHELAPDAAVWLMPD